MTEALWLFLLSQYNNLYLILLSLTLHSYIYFYCILVYIFIVLCFVTDCDFFLGGGFIRQNM